jgi:hypothetical protein
VKAQLASGRQGGGGALAFPQFLEMFRAELLDLREILAFLQMGSAAPDGLATTPQVAFAITHHAATSLALACLPSGVAWPCGGIAAGPPPSFG